MKHHKFAYYAKNRKLFIRFSVVLFSSLMLILFSLFMQIRVFETKKDHNEDLYGSWYASVYDVTKENENMLYDHQMLDTIGKMSVYGQVQYNDEYAGNIGVVDDSFYELSNISLKTGKLPSSPEEIAIEAYILDGLGIDYTLDQKISLSIQSGDQIFKKEYRLCGILDNYSATWINQGSLVNFFIQEDDSFFVQQTNLFILPLQDYFDVMDEIILKNGNRFVYNDMVEFVYDPFSRQNLPYTILACFAIIYTLLLITYTFYNWTNQHTKEIQMLKSLGASSFMLCKDFLKLLSKALILPIMIFGICCILFSIYPITIVVSLSIYLAALILVIIFCFLQIRKVPLNINSFSDQEMVIKQAIRVKYKKQTPFRMMLRSLRFHWKQELIQMMISIVLLVFLYQGLASQIHNQYIADIWDETSDISLESSRSLVYMTQESEDVYQVRHERYDSIDKEIVQKLTANQNLTKYETYYYDNTSYITWNGMEDSDIWDSGLDQFIIDLDWNLNKQIFPDMVYVPVDSLEDFLEENLSEGTFDKEAYLKGETVYIYLPEYTFYIDELGSQLSANPEFFYDADKIYQEDTIHVGDTITIHSYDKEDKKVKIGGIIREYKPSNSFQYDLHTPYRIYASDIVFGLDDPVSHIELYYDKEADTLPIETDISKIASENNMMFSNNVFIKQENYQIAHDELILNCMLSFIVLCVMVFTQYHFKKQQIKEKLEKQRVFFQLGIDSDVFMKMRVVEMILKLILIFVSALMLFGLIQYIGYLQDANPMLTYASRFSKQQWSWIGYGLINLVFGFLFVINNLFYKNID